MKKTNKGFSMVELIIVIAIMAILAGALAPALIKYINKSRLSTDIQTANTIATGVQTALATEKGYDSAATATYSGKFVSMATMWSNSNAYTDEVKNTCGGKNAPKPKAKKCNDKTCTKQYAAANAANTDFAVKVDPVANTVEIRVGGHTLYPDADSCIKD